MILLGNILNTDSYAKVHGYKDNPELSTNGTPYNRKTLTFLFFIPVSYLAGFDIGFCSYPMVADFSSAQAMWVMTTSPWLLSVLLIPMFYWYSVSGLQDVIVRCSCPNLCYVHRVRSVSHRRSFLFHFHRLLRGLACRTGSGL